MLYMVRVRDVFDGCERWLDDGSGKRFIVTDRQTADCAALAVARSAAMELAYVVPIDPAVEMIL